MALMDGGDRKQEGSRRSTGRPVGRPPKWDKKLELPIIILYYENDYPADKLLMDPEALLGFVKELQERVGHKLDPPAVAGQLLALRKLGRLPRLGRAHKGPNFIFSIDL